VEGKGWGRGKKRTLARKPMDFEKRPLVFTVEFIHLLTTLSPSKNESYMYLHTRLEGNKSNVCLKYQLFLWYNSDRSFAWRSLHCLAAKTTYPLNYRTNRKSESYVWKLPARVNSLSQGKQQPVAGFLNSVFRYLNTKNDSVELKRGCRIRLSKFAGSCWIFAHDR